MIGSAPFVFIPTKFVEPEPQRWKRGAERKLAETRILDLLSVQFTHPFRGTQRDFIVVDAPDWVNVVALTADKKIVLVRQFRYGTNQLSLEIPGGVIEPKEDPVVAAVRELKEETGYSGSNARLIASIHPNPAIQNNRCHLVLVENAVLSDVVQWDEDEEMSCEVMPVEAVLALAREGKITHSLVLCGLFHFEGWWRSQSITEI